MTLPPNARRVVEYIDGIIEVHQKDINSGDLTPISYKAMCVANKALARVRGKIVEELSKEDDE